MCFWILNLHHARLFFKPNLLIKSCLVETSGFFWIYSHAYIKYIVRFPINDWSLTGLPVEHICLLYRAHLLYFNIPLIIIFKIARCMVWPQSVHCRSEQQCFANGVCFNNVVEFWRWSSPIDIYNDLSKGSGGCAVHWLSRTVLAWRHAHLPRYIARSYIMHRMHLCWTH